MRDGTSWRFPTLQRDLVLVAGAGLAVAALIGAGFGAALDVLIRHRRAV